MTSRFALVVKTVSLLAVALIVVTAACTRKVTAQASPANLIVPVKTPFHFVVYGDTRFHDPNDKDAANPEARMALVKAIADVSPAFICFTGDIVFNGYDPEDWKVWDRETSIWREKGIHVYPALGNHDLHGKLETALGNYFQRFPDLANSRYYSVRAANSLILTLDSDVNEVTGPQGEWLAAQLDHVPADVEFVLIIMHHPPYTSSSDEKMFGGGHSARSPEIALAKMLEDRQAKARYKIILFSGHVHNYERHQHGGVTYFVSGGGGAHAYPIQRAADDPFQSKEINYHYLFIAVDQRAVKITMNRLNLSSGSPVWTQPDSVTITIPNAAAVASAAGR